MLKKFRSRLTYANVIASIALFAALGGTSYAAATIGSRQIKNNSIQGKDIRNSTIGSRDVKNGALAAGDFKRGQVVRPLYAYISDAGAAANASVAYGRGVTDVVDQGGDGGYKVSFDRSLEGCVVNAVAGTGNNRGGGVSSPGVSSITMGDGPDSAPNVPGGENNVYLGGFGTPVRDTSFMIQAVC